MSEPEPAAHHELEIKLPEPLFGGVWANFAVVSHSEHEFTIDFVRTDAGMRNGLVTARVNVSPLFITQLQEALRTNWEQYAKKAMPREVQENDDAES